MIGMRIGVDFDNCIVQYDDVFHIAAKNRNLISHDVPANKSAIREHLFRKGMDEAWTELQGHVYGKAIADAHPFPGVVEFFRQCRTQGFTVHIISHKTRTPACGPKHDLHQAARNWLTKQGFHAPDEVDLPVKHVFFEQTRKAKIARIRDIGCQWFIDDLPEVLEDPGFPSEVARILFDPEGLAPSEIGFRRARSWQEIEAMIFHKRGTET